VSRTAFRKRKRFFNLKIMIKIKEEFKELIPPLTDEEFKQLEDNCLAEGIREKIITWNGFIIDGHNRYKIATKWDLDFKTESKHFYNEIDVKIWMAYNQLGRRNLTDFVKGELYSVIEDLLKKKGIEKLKEVGSKYGEGHSKKEEPLSIIDKPSHNTRKEVAEKLGWSTGKKGMFDVVKKKASEEVKEKLRTGEISINAAYKEIKKDLYKEKMQNRINTNAEKPISKEEQELLNKLKNGETVVININTNFHVLKYAKDNGLYKQIDRFSEFGNPFFLDSDGNRDEVCDGYIEYFKHKRSLHAKVKDLKGKALGCHCYPLRCHGDYLKKLTIKL